MLINLKNEKEKSQENPINQWTRVNKLLVSYKQILFVLAAVVFGFFILTCYLVNKDSLVIGITGGEKLFFTGERKELPISESDVEAIARQYINARYSWDAFRAENVSKELAPYTSTGLLQKLNDSFAKNKTLSKNGLSQGVLIRKLKLVDGKVLAQIDQVIQVSEKMKLVQSIGLTLTVIRGYPNHWNPLGLYVNSVLEHQSE